MVTLASLRLNDTRFLALGLHHRDPSSMQALRAGRRLVTLFSIAMAAIAVAPIGKAWAQIGSDRYSSIVVDAATGNVLSAANPDELRFPASLTKMMTIYMLFEAIRDHRIALNQYVPVSENAASMSPTKLGLVPGSIITVEQCLLGLVTRSANDAASALGELLGGDEERFAEMMTLRAHALGMANTTFRNASGLPDWGQVSTARDMAILARHLIQDFPGFYHYFSTPYFMYGGHLVRGHNPMLGTYYGADGLKTGYTEASGLNMVTSAIRGDTRLIGVVFGAAKGGERNAHMAMLLDQGFDRMGVPPPAFVSHRGPALRIPALISEARAAPVPPLPRPLLRIVQPRVARVLPAARRADPRLAPHVERATTYTYRGSAPAQLRPAAVQVTVPAPHPTTTTRTAHGTTYVRYPG
jgi:D-alanyl-D-alanine carboxypeptidase